MTKKYLSSIILLLTIGISQLSFSQTTKFQRILGGSGDDRSYSMAQTKDGGYILAGYTKSFGAGGNDAYLTKTDGLGKIVWSKTYGTKDDETAWKVRQTRDSGYIVVGTTSSAKGDGIFFKTDKNGTLSWSKHFNSDSAEEIYNVIESRDNGELYVTGFVKTDSNGTDAFLGKFSSSGNLIWYKKFGTELQEEAYALIEEPNGNVAVVGVVINDTVTIGGKGGSSNKDEDIFIARFDKNGNNKWLKNFGTTSKEQAWDIKYLKGEYVIVGWTATGSIGGDNLIAKIDTSGNFIDAYLMAGSGSTTGSSKAFSVNIDPDETFSITGYINMVANNRECYYMNMNKSGSIKSFQLLGGSGTDGHWPSEITRTIDGGFTIFTSSNSFKASSSYELYLVRMDDKGNVNCNQNAGFITSTPVQLQSGYFGNMGFGLISNNITLTSNTITTVKDSVLCCKLQAQVAGPTVRICKGESVRIGKPAIPGYVYKWTSVGGSFTSTEASPLVNPASNTTYKLVVSSSDGKCLKDSATIALSIKADLKDRNFVRDTFFCAGDTIQIKAKSGAINYAWLGKNTNANGQTISVSKADVIVLTITDTTTCVYKDTLTVTTKKLPTFNLGNDTTICDNTTITITGPPNMKTYSWNGGQFKTRSITTVEERTHTLMVVDSFGCRASDSKALFINAAGNRFSLGPDTAICNGINYTIFGPGALKNYFWNGVSSFSPNLVVKTGGTYICQAQNTFGCIHRDTIVIKLKPDPTFSLGPDGGVCATGGRTLKGPAGVSAYYWNDATTNQNLKVFFAGIYWLRVTGTNGCIFTDSIKMTIVQNPKPVLGNDTTIDQCDSIYLDAGNYASFLWNTGATTRVIKVKTANLYSVTVTDANTCTGEADRKISTKFTKPCTGKIGNLMQIPGLTVQPNPANNYINIQWLVNNKEAFIILYDAFGKKIIEQAVASGLYQSVLDVSQIAKGVYYLKVMNESASQTVKIILE
jgi:hypothetical protein